MLKKSDFVDSAEYSIEDDFIHYYGSELKSSHSFMFAPDLFEEHAAAFDVNKEGYIIGIWLFTASKKFKVDRKLLDTAMGFDISLSVTDEKINLMVNTKIDNKNCNYQCDGYFFSKCKEIKRN